MPETSWRILEGDARERLRELEPGSIQTCVTSPPYFGLRDYGHEGQIGLEPTPEYVAALVETFREVRRVLRNDGTLWLNLGDTYAGSRCGPAGDDLTGCHVVESDTFVKSKREGKRWGGGDVRVPGVKPKDLVGIPWLVAFALRADGWYLRSDIIWAKPNPMPESVTDRPTKAHEYLFLLAKSRSYYYDAEAIREPDLGLDHPRSVLDGQPSLEPSNGVMAEHKGLRTTEGRNGAGRNKRSVWTVATQPFPGAHSATFPPKLIEPCILAGSRPDDLVLDPFAGAGTTGLVATRLDRSFVGIELNPTYAEMARQRIRDDAPLLNTVAEDVAASSHSPSTQPPA